MYKWVWQYRFADAINTMSFKNKVVITKPDKLVKYVLNNVSDEEYFEYITSGFISNHNS